MDIEKKVLLLGILKKEEGESLSDVLASLEDAKVFTFKQGKQYVKELKKEMLLIDGELSVSGLARAKEAEQEFKI